MPELWNTLRAILEGALEREGDERARFVEAQCGADLALRDEVESLLELDTRSRGLEVPGRERVAEMLAAEAHVPRELGPYRLERLIGAGGMGAVWLARRVDGAFEQTVAVKLMRRGFDFADLLRRFENERALLAALAHRSIAHVFDGGASDDGTPYLVMEFVEGLPIDEHCEKRGLDLRARLLLFAEVCDAVHHAHKSLVVHRDLKPSNILVTADGAPKLLDFGIAKLLPPEGVERPLDRTQIERRLLTPSYASPEQLRGERLTTASDQFSLGVILWELAALRRAFDDQRSDTTALARPSDAASARPELARELRGDVDAIVAKATHADPARRYASVDELALDVRRQLDGLPVLARPDTLAYRSAKFVRKHRMQVGALAAMLIALIGGVGYTQVHYRRALAASDREHAQRTTTQARIEEARVAREAEAREREQAEHRFDEVRRLADTFLFGVYDMLGRVEGSTAARELLVKTAREYLDRLARERQTDYGLLCDLAHAWLRVAEIQYNPGGPSLGNATAALESYDRALTVQRALAAMQPDNVKTLAVEYQVRQSLATALTATGRLTEAIEMNTRALAACEEVLRRGPATPEMQRHLSQLHLHLGDAARTTGDDRTAMLHIEAAYEIEAAASRSGEGDVDTLQSLARALNALGDRQTARLELDKAIASERRAIEIFESLLARDPDNAVFRRDLALSRQLLSRAHESAFDYDSALDQCDRAVEPLRALAEVDPDNLTAQRDLQAALGDRARLLRAVHREQEALDVVLESLRALEALSARNPENRQLLRDVAIARYFAAKNEIDVGQRDEGLTLFEQAVTGFEELSRASPENVGARAEMLLQYSELAQELYWRAEGGAPDADRRSHLERANELFRRALEGLHELRDAGRLDASVAGLLPGIEERAQICEDALAALE